MAQIPIETTNAPQAGAEVTKYIGNEDGYLVKNTGSGLQIRIYNASVDTALVVTMAAKRLTPGKNIVTSRTYTIAFGKEHVIGQIEKDVFNTTDTHSIDLTFDAQFAGAQVTAYYGG